ncbi:hypothetical protein [Streptosporangium sp. V21-05]|uniref:hypothetical protein n=1 Tax=Streptosporangium sp. V21-05 TaxID=3446115 RepID=UPI003F53D951
MDDLDTVLDVEAGLAAILPAAVPPPAPVVQPQPHATEQDRPASGQLTWPIGPEDRLMLRLHPQVMTTSRNLVLIGILAHRLDLAFGRIRALCPELVRDLDLDLDRGSVLDLVSVLSRVLDCVRDLARDLDLDLDSVRDRVRALARSLARDLDLVLRLDLAGGIVDFHVAEVREAIALALGQDLPGLDEASLKAFLDDFTTADLRAANVTGVNLDGVRWSESGTKWPRGMDTEALKVRSEEIGTGSGIHVVRSGSATVHDFADLA